ncbi:hypothetical protein [Neobacillus mesonae]|uniref:hypothetical protein n=1 Tax=Neobacillus mesonae TaxID=1193713 RepID=UPI002E219548|nr:hypothetical protein [Neobacillus mesonae]
MKFFSFKKKKPEKTDNTNSLLLAKLDRLIELLEKQQKATEGKNIHLEHVQIDHLENIVFRLDNIEIDQLSGKLLIGTNISASEEFAESLIEKVDKESLKKEVTSKTNPPEESSSESKMTKTSKGYRFRN